jgi:hypothetical protein
VRDRLSAGKPWRFGFASSNLQCFQPQPFAFDEPKFTVADQGVFLFLGLSWMVLVIALLAFGGLCCWRGKLAPKPGDARSSDDHAALRGPSNVKPRRMRVDPECGGLCCSDLSTPCARGGLFLLCALSLALPLVSLALDVWGQSTEENALLRQPFTMVQTTEGIQQVRVSLEDQEDHTSPAGITSYAYDCSSGSEYAQAECRIHSIAGMHALVCGALAATCALAVVLMSMVDLCCPWLHCSSSAAHRSADLDHSHSTDTGLPRSSSHARVRYPFSVSQWRLATFGCIFSSAACAFWLGAFFLSKQYLTRLLPAASWLLMGVSACTALLVALLYRRAIRVTPREGYIFLHSLRAYESNQHTSLLKDQTLPTAGGTSQAQAVLHSAVAPTATGGHAATTSIQIAPSATSVPTVLSQSHQSSYHSFSAHGTLHRSQALGVSSHDPPHPPSLTIAHSYAFASTPQQHEQLAHGPALMHLAGAVGRSMPSPSGIGSALLARSMDSQPHA